MNPLRATLALGALASALLIATPAFAGTDYCDNDAVGYPCYTPVAIGWSYGHGPGDWHGDHRRKSSGDFLYEWVFNSERTYDFYV